MTCENNGKSMLNKLYKEKYKGFLKELTLMLTCIKIKVWPTNIFDAHKLKRKLFQRCRTINLSLLNKGENRVLEVSPHWKPDPQHQSTSAQDQYTRQTLKLDHQPETTPNRVQTA